jgi:hypothetical protein
MPKHYDPQPYNEALERAIERAAANMRQVHETKRKLDRHAARRWMREQERKAQESDFLDDLEEIEEGGDTLDNSEISE